MRKILALLIILTFLGCKNNPETFIEHLNGYWEIKEVKLSDGTKKEYTYNETIDFISINDSLTGFRKKLKPDFQGTFKSSTDAEQLKVILENDSLNLYYSTPFSEWKETVLNATKENLIIINSRKDVYLYKRYQPITIE